MVSIATIEAIHELAPWQNNIKFAIETVIGLLTIYYLYLKIKDYKKQKS